LGNFKQAEYNGRIKQVAQDRIGKKGYAGNIRSQQSARIRGI
jgi:hypothetical protein